MVPETVIQAAVAALKEALVGGDAAPAGQDLLMVELDGRRWILSPRPDGSGSWTVALPTPRGDPEPGSELLLPLMPGERFPWVWWTRFCQATDPLPAPPPGAALPAACRSAHFRRHPTDPTGLRSVGPMMASANPLPATETVGAAGTGFEVRPTEAKDEQ